MPAPAGAFQDRAERARLRAAVHGGGTAVLCQVLSGMGGVGKTQLAAEYAHEVRAAGAVELLVWVSAGSRSAVVASFAEAAAEVCGADPGQPDRAAERFLAWLQSEGRRWLVVLDDVTDPADLTGLWPPAVPYGRTVVTTRRRDAALTGAGRRRIDVGVFTPEESAAYLAAALAAYGVTEPGTELAGLAADLGHLPLAPSQATAYLVDAGLPVAAYRALLAERTARLDELSPDVLPDGQTRTTAAAWELSVEYADRLRPAGLARPMLELAAFLDANGIPAEVLTSGPARAYLAAHAGAAVSRAEASGALRALHRVSLVQAPDPGDAAEHPAVRVHQLVQRATRDALPAERFDAAARAAADALFNSWPSTERDPAFAEKLRACAAALETWADAAGSLYRPDAHSVLFRAGTSLAESGQVAAGAAHFRRVTADAVEHLGADHPDVLVGRHNLAHCLGEAGDEAGAFALYSGILADFRDLLDPDDPRILGIRHSLAFWQNEAGDKAGAARAYGALLADRSRVLGPDHRQTLLTVHNLAHCLAEAGDVRRAVGVLEELIQRTARVLGPDHPYTLTTRHSLARWQLEGGNAEEATAVFETLLADRLRVLGPDHPDTLATRNNLAYALGRSGDAAGAAASYAALVDDVLRILGPDHPRTLVTRANWARWRGHSGDTAGAVAALKALLADRLRVLGPDHPDTLATRNSVTHWERHADGPGPPA
ncbi:tetratricopeptide repeat protein [Streptomyces sp. NPDC004031]